MASNDEQVVLLFSFGCVSMLCHHALSSWHHSAPEDWTPNLDYGPALMLTGDQGIYLMSNGLPRYIAPGRSVSHHVFAQGFDPAQNPNWRDDAPRFPGTKIQFLDWCDTIMQIQYRSKQAPRYLRVVLDSSGIQIDQS